MPRKPPITLLKLLAIVGIIVLLLAVFLPRVTSVRDPSNRMLSASNLRQIGIAFHNYADDSHGLPPHALCDKAGKPLLSWCVQLLPYFEEEDLYKQFKLDEPWDSPHNATLISKMPRVFLKPGANRSQTFTTHYRVFTGPGTAFERPGLQFKSDFPDGKDNTILVVEAADAVPWTKPEELVYNPAGPIPSLGGLWKRPVLQVLFADCALGYVRQDLPQDQMRALITRNGGETVDRDNVD